MNPFHIKRLKATQSMHNGSYRSHSSNVLPTGSNTTGELDASYLCQKMIIFQFITNAVYNEYNRNNTRRVHINMVNDPRQGDSNAQTRRAEALLLSIPRVNSFIDMDTDDFIPFISWKLFYIFGDIQGCHYRAKSKMILTGLYCPVLRAKHDIKRDNCWHSYISTITIQHVSKLATTIVFNWCYYWITFVKI